MADIRLREFNGISDSQFRGIKGSLLKSVGLNIHDVPGQISVNQALKKDSGTTVTAFCRVSVSVSTGVQIWFSYTDGKIWERSAAGVWLLVYTTAPSAGTAGCYGAAEYNAYIYWATQSRLHRMPIANLGTAAGWTANVALDWKTFTKTDSEFHPMQVQNQTLFIGDANLMASVDSSATFSASALDLITPQRIKCIAPFDVDLIIGTIIATTNNSCQIVRWDTVQTTWQFAEPVRENGINSFHWIGATLLAQAGTYGNLYYYDGLNLKPYKRIPGTWSSVQFGEVYPQSGGNYKGVPIFGFSNSPAAGNTTGNPADQGIYSIGNYSKDYPAVLNGPEYVISQNLLASIEIGSILVEGNLFYVAWKDGSNYGVDVIDTANKYASAYLETMAIIPDPRYKTVFGRMWANYQSMPSGTSLAFQYYADYGTVTSTTSSAVQDTTINEYYVDEAVEARTFRMRINFTISSNSTPVVEEFGVDFNTQKLTNG